MYVHSVSHFRVSDLYTHTQLDVARFTLKLFVSSGKTTSSAHNRSAFRIARSELNKMLKDCMSPPSHTHTGLLQDESVPSIGMIDVEDIGVDDSLDRQVDMEELLKGDKINTDDVI